MNSKYKKPNYKDMKTVIGQCARLNMSRVMFSVLMFYFVFMVAIFVGVVPVLAAINGLSNFSSAAYSFLPIVGLAVLIILFIFLYGLNVSVSKVIEREDGGLGFLFYGFKKNFKKVLCSSLIFTVLCLIAVVLSMVFFSLIFNENEDFLALMNKVYVESEGAEVSLNTEFLSENLNLFVKYVSIFMLITYATIFIFFFPFVFVCLNIYTNPKQNVFKAFGKSAVMLWGKVFHFIGFVVSRAWQPLAVIIACVVVTRAMPGQDSLLVDFANFISFVAELMAIARIVLAYTVYYYFLTGNITLSNHSESSPEVLEVRDALPGESHDDVVYSNSDEEE